MIDKIDLLEFLNINNDSLNTKWLEMILSFAHENNICIEQFKKISLNDEKVYEYLKNNNLSAIDPFEIFSKYPLQSVCQYPNSFEELKNLFAIYRPAVLESGIVDEYFENRNNPTNIPCQIEELKDVFEPILQNSYGVPIYHEQVIKILQNVLNISYETAKELRKKFAKRKISYFEFTEYFLGNGSYKDDYVGRFYALLEFYTPYTIDENFVISYTKQAYYLAYFRIYTNNNEMGSSHAILSIY